MPLDEFAAELFAATPNRIMIADGAGVIAYRASSPTRDRHEDG